MVFRQQVGTPPGAGRPRARLPGVPGPREPPPPARRDPVRRGAADPVVGQGAGRSRRSLLVADEISLGLAPVMMDAVYEGLGKINEAGTALLIVEQQVDRVLDIAGTAVVLEHGTVAYNGPAAAALAAVESVLATRGERAMAATSDRSGSDPGRGRVRADGRAVGRGRWPDREVRPAGGRGSQIDEENHGR